MEPNMQPPSDQRIHRGSDRIIGGVCSGLAEALHLDPIWVRLAFVVLAFAQGLGVVLYLVLLVIMPERATDRPAGRTAFDSMAADIKRAWAELRRQFGGSPAAGGTTSASPVPEVPPVAADPNAPLPPQGTQVVPAPPPSATARPGIQNQSLVLGVILVLIGLVFLVSNTGLVNWSEIWPIALVVLGVVLLARTLEKRS
jgi:phage shock protein PspC (stress-responsive transcriptional regulator)